MRNHIILLFILFTTGIQVIKAQTTTSNNDANVMNLLTRKWKMDESVIPQAVEDVLDNVRKQNPEQAKQLEAQKALLADGLRVGSVEYKADGNYEMKILGNVIAGTWRLSADNKQLIRKDQKGEESVNEIVEITNDKLIVINSIKRKIIYIPF